MNAPTTPIGFVAPEPAQLAPLFPGYQIVSLIATGGMGAVYRAVQKSLDRTVAIKILPREFSKDAAFCAGFEAEAKAMARLNHPNLIAVYDFGEVDGMLYIIMEYVPGKSLFHAAHGIAIDPGEVIRLVTGICNGLSHAHENGIIHRDIKPSNILLDLNAQPKIGDFGLAHPIEHKIIEGQEIYGTPHYTAPEVLNSPQSVGLRADIFSVGVLLHELLTGRLPAEDRRPASTIAHCDHRFDAIVRRATNPLPENRYSSAAEIAKDLHSIAVSFGPKSVRPATPAQKVPQRPVAAPPRPTTANPKTVSMRKKSSPVPGIIVLLVLIAVTVYGYIKYSDRLKPLTLREHESTPASSTHESPSPLPDKKHAPHDAGQTIDSWKKLLNPPPDKPRDSENEKPADNQFKPESTTEPSPPPADIESIPLVHPGPESMTKPDSSLEYKPVDHNQPKFDVPAFLQRARRIMKDKAAPSFANRDDRLRKNLADFDRAVKRLVRKIEWRQTRESADEKLKDFVSECRQNGNLLPVKRNGRLGEIGDVRDIYEEYLGKQSAICDALVQSLSQLSPTYITGLRNQVERLKADDDAAAISLIEAEIEKTSASDSYFSNLMLDADNPRKEPNSGEPGKP